MTLKALLTCESTKLREMKKIASQSFQNIGNNYGCDFLRVSAY